MASEARCLELHDARWRRFVSGASGALPFHHPEWALLIAECYGMRAFAFTLVDERGNVLAGVPIVEVASALRSRRWISLPFTDRCPPLVSTPEYAGALATALDRARRERGLRGVEVRGVLGPSTLSFPRDASAVLHRRRLEPDATAVFRALPASVRQNVRAAARRGVTVRQAETRTELTRTFYGLHVETRRRQGLPVQPRRLFDLLWDRMLERELGTLVLAYVKSTPVAGAVFLAWNGTVTYKYGASLRHYWPLRPNDLLFWTAISAACERGSVEFDLGRTDSVNVGLRRFKNSWGSEEPLTYCSIGAPPPTSSRRPPKFVTAMIRRSPRWVARLSGELLYRNAA